MKLLYTFVLLLSFGAVQAQEVGLFNKDGKAIAYIDTADKDMPVYLYNGKPVAYLDKDNIYGFNGKHLGWYDKGLVRTPKGEIIGASKEASNRYTEYEPFKSFKQFKPFKTFPEFPPFKVIGQLSWTDDSFEKFLLAGMSKQ